MDIHDGTIDRFLAILWEKKGSDLLLTVDSPPRIRVDGKLTPISGEAVLGAADMEHVASEILSHDQLQRVKALDEVDFSHGWRQQARLRGNAFIQKDEMAIALRIIPADIPDFQQLGLPEAVQETAKLSQGLVLFTGPTGSGKSTSLASLLAHINATRPVHILTIEDPIEYVHTHKMAAVSQREVGSDTKSFAAALKSALREDPDVILVGEMRDPESIAFALTLAETGHLVFSTLHTNDTAQALDRIIDVFPPERQEQIRVQMAGALSAIIAQRLIVKPQGGRVAAFEVLIANPAIRNLIREGKTRQIRNVLTTSQAIGMQTLEMSLTRLMNFGLISRESAMEIAIVPGEIGR
jgi:twitching motility protein PilT